MVGIISISFSLIITLLLFTFARIANPQTITTWLLLAKISGLFGSILIAWNYVLATKNIYIEKLFSGLDKAYKIHNIIGNLGFILVVLHPTFLILNSLPYDMSKVYLFPSISNLPYAFGILSLYSLILLIFFTIFVNLPYKLWKLTHEFMGLVIIFASLHGLYITSDTSLFLPLMLWILIWNIIAIIAFFYKRYFYYSINSKDNYVVNKIEQDKNYLSLELIAVSSNEALNFKAGQFAFFSLSNDERNDHPFSILEQNGLNLKVGVKIKGEFTLKLSQLTIDSKITVLGPFGSFSNSLADAKNIVFVSGGIGITPFLSMIKSIRPDQTYTMIHTCRTDEPILFTKMFSNYKIILHYSDKNGHLNAQNIKQYISLNSDTYIYICGPTRLMKNLMETLPEYGVQKNKIIYEDFDLKP